MPRRRRSQRSIYRPLKVAKYSNETFAAISTVPANDGTTPIPQYWITFTKASDVLGTRKVKHFLLTISSNSEVPLIWALVFVPEGTHPSPLQQGNSIVDNYLLSASLYNPNQNVIMSGITGGINTQVERFKSNLSRNLNSGDKICLIVSSLDATYEAFTIDSTLNYAIAY